MTAPTLYDKTLKIFDSLNNAGELLYSRTEPELIEASDGFLFRFRHSKALTTKPLTAIHNPKTSPNPFLPPDPAFIVSRPSPTHTMILNKFCPIRPMLLIHSNEFEPQESDLTSADISTLWTTYIELEKGLERRIKERNEDDLVEERELMATYGCGADAGASQAHKHMQIFPKDGNLWPDLRLDEISVFPNLTTHPHPPYHHYITRLPPSPTPEDVYKIYLALLKPTKEYTPTDAYNFILTKEWMMLIPRTRGKLDKYGVNAAGMMGMVWIKSEEERNAWKNVGYTGFLEHCAIKNPRRERAKNGSI